MTARALLSTLALLAICLCAPVTAQAAGGSAMGWGYNASGQVGNGAPSSEGCSCFATPVPLLGVDGVTEIAAGYEFGLALRSDGSVLSWGYNYGGELGNGNTDLDAVPKPVAGISNAIGVAAGTAHALVLLADGRVLAWGENGEGQLGLGSPTGPETCHTTTQCSTRPLAVPGITNAIAVAGGTYDSYALLADGTVLAWGDNDSGAVGDGTSSSNKCSCVASPTAVAGVNAAVAIDGGQYTGAALLADGTVRAWGRNVIGELGTGTVSPPEGCACLGPVSPAGLVGVRQLAMGGAHNVALLGNGLAQSWGYNTKGQVGIGTESSGGCFCVTTPTTIGALSGVREVDAGNEHSVALLPNGTLATWGNNDDGELGDGTEDVDRSSPAAVPNLGGVSEVATGEYNTYAIIGPSQALSIEFAGAGAGTVGGDGIVCSSACSQPFAQGQVKALRAVPAVVGQFAGWTGGGCSGTGPCFARLDSDQTVTATFGPPKGTRITKLKRFGKKKDKAKLSFTAPGAVTGFQCMLVKPARKGSGAKKSAKGKKRKPRFASCASPKTYKHLKPGKYTFRVRALNALGADAKPAKRVFKMKAAKRRHRSGR